jgi:hypothetical protein
MPAENLLARMREKQKPIIKKKPWQAKDKSQLFRLPDKSRFEAVYNAQIGKWKVTLITPDFEIWVEQKSIHLAFSMCGQAWKKAEKKKRACSSPEPAA